jgi:hydrogenase 3 maturation protease
MLSETVKQALLPHPIGKTCYLIMGNALRGDDGVGPWIGGRLVVPSERVRVLDAGERLDRWVEAVVQWGPDKLIIIDAANFGQNPGNVAVLSSQTMEESALSTHAFPLNIFVSYIDSEKPMRKEYIGIQVQECCLGQHLSKPVEAAAQEIVSFLDGFFRAQSSQG